MLLAEQWLKNGFSFEGAPWTDGTVRRLSARFDTSDREEDRPIRSESEHCLRRPGLRECGNIALVQPQVHDPAEHQRATAAWQNAKLETRPGRILYPPLPIAPRLPVTIASGAGARRVACDNVGCGGAAA